VFASALKAAQTTLLILVLEGRSTPRRALRRIVRRGWRARMGLISWWNWVNVLAFMMRHFYLL